MRILLVEDEGVAAEMAATELTRASSCTVDVAGDPDDALAALQRHEFDVVVVDLLYREQSYEFEVRRRNGQVRLTDPRLHRSGLAVVHAVRAAGSPAVPVLWTNGETSRTLHITFAHEQFGCRVMCPKDAVGKLPQAVEAAMNDVEHIDPLLRMHLPPPSAPSLHETFLRTTAKLAVWRAMALGIHDHTAIAKVVGVKAATVRKGMDQMRARLAEFSTGCSRDGPPTAEVIRFASQNWQFFLDDTVRELYP